LRDENPFSDRREAGRELAASLSAYADREDVVVLALPRGGVPVAFEVAAALRAPLDVFVVRKLGVPSQPELAFGAMASGGLTLLNDDVVSQLGIDESTIKDVVAHEREEIMRRELAYRGERRLSSVAAKVVILVDDGLATGSTMRVAVAALQELGPERIVAAVPVAPPSVCRQLEQEADEVHCLLTPAWLRAVSTWYRDFRQVSDDEVSDLLEQARPGAAAGAQAGMAQASPAALERAIRPVVVPSGEETLAADLAVPHAASGIVAFAHGSGSGRKSPRNRAVAEVLYEAGFATLLLDLLTEDEERFDARTGRLRFDIELLAGRLLAAAEWIAAQPDLARLSLGYFGASTGAAAALVAAARQGAGVRAVVSRGGRPDLAGEALAQVTAPTLLIVGGADREVLVLNQRAQRLMRCETRLEVIPGAGHLFEEPGAIWRVAELAREWFVTVGQAPGARAAAGR
jgi:putative phosphoribosyl transferase